MDEESAVAAAWLVLIALILILTAIFVLALMVWSA